MLGMKPKKENLHRKGYEWLQLLCVPCVCTHLHRPDVNAGCLPPCSSINLSISSLLLLTYPGWPGYICSIGQAGLEPKRPAWYLRCVPLH